MNVWPRASGGVKWNFLASTNPFTHSRYTVLSVTRHRRTWWKQPRISLVIGSRNGKTAGRLDLSTCYRGSSPAILFGNVRDTSYISSCTNLRRICISIPPFSIYIHPRVWLLVRSFVHPIRPPISRHFVESTNSLSYTSVHRETRALSYLFSFSDLYARSIFRETSSFPLPADVQP